MFTSTSKQSPEQQLFAFVNTNDLHGAARLISKGANLKSRNKNYQTALHLAILIDPQRIDEKTLDIIKTLVAKDPSLLYEKITLEKLVKDSLKNFNTIVTVRPNETIANRSPFSIYQHQKEKQNRRYVEYISFKDPQSNKIIKGMYFENNEHYLNADHFDSINAIKEALIAGISNPDGAKLWRTSIHDTLITEWALRHNNTLSPIDLILQKIKESCQGQNNTDNKRIYLNMLFAILPLIPHIPQDLKEKLGEILILAAQDGDRDTVRILIAAGASSEKLLDEKTALAMAIEKYSGPSVADDNQNMIDIISMLMAYDLDSLTQGTPCPDKLIHDMDKDNPKKTKLEKIRDRVDAYKNNTATSSRNREPRELNKFDEKDTVVFWLTYNKDANTFFAYPGLKATADSATLPENTKKAIKQGKRDSRRNRIAAEVLDNKKDPIAHGATNCRR